MDKKEDEEEGESSPTSPTLHTLKTLESKLCSVLDCCFVYTILKFCTMSYFVLFRAQVNLTLTMHQRFYS